MAGTQIPGGFPSCLGSTEKQAACRVKSNILFSLKNSRNYIYIGKESLHNNWKPVNDH